MARGGTREGRPGKSYGQRTDLNQPTPSTGYGTRASQERSMKAVPIQPAPRPATPPPSMPAPFDRFTDRPDEPVTAGLPTGAGPGPEVLRVGQAPVEMLRALYEQFPYEDLRELLEEIDG